MDKIIKQYFISPAAGKRLIAKSLLYVPKIADALDNKTLVVIAGTTNGYVAEEIFKRKNRISEFSKKRFFRGISLPPGTDTGRSGDDSKFPGDIVFVKGKWEEGKTIFDVADSLQKGDIIIKGANAVNLDSRQAAILIGHPSAGTIGVSLPAVVGRRVSLYLPVGLEKRVNGDLNKIADMLNSTNASGARYLPVNGEIITELEAIETITGAKAQLVAAGGVCRAEGSCWLAVSGSREQMENVDILINDVRNEPNFEI